MVVQGDTVHYACGIWRTAPKHEASVFGMVEFKPHHRGYRAYLASRHHGQQSHGSPEEPLQTSKGPCPCFQRVVHPEPEAKARQV